MSLTAAAIVLSSLGAVLELIGLALVVEEIRSDRERGRHFADALDQPGRPQRTYPAPVSSAVVQLTYRELEQSGQALERFRAEVANGFIKLKKFTDAELDKAVEEIQRDIAERDAKLRDGLRYVLAGSTRQRVTGVGLLVAGVILAAGGSVLGNLT
jgi:hypothetical protein